MQNMNKLIFDSNGICVLKKLISNNKSEEVRHSFLDLLSKNALETVQNPFGNYVIQHVIDEWGRENVISIIRILISNIISLSMQKFSSNVIEKLFDLCDKETRMIMNKELFNASKISSLLKNKYGNFVIQKAIQVMSKEEKLEIKDYLVKKVSLTSNKEKARLNSLIEVI
jgi:hypothetical protein